MKKQQFSPSIIFNLKASLPKNKSQFDDFVRCKTSFDIVGYNLRKKAISDDDREVLKIMESTFDLADAGDISHYIGERPGSTGGFDKDKFLSKQDLANIRKELRTTQSVVWTAVISFTPMLADKICNNKNQAQELIKEHLPALCKNSELNFENLNYFGALHTNTAHPHIHLTFWEKSPQHINKYGKVCFNYTNPTKKGHLPIQSINDFKMSLALSADKTSYSYYSLRDEIRSGLKSDIKNDSIKANMLYLKDKDIFDSKITQYSKLPLDHQKRIDNSVKAFIDSRPHLKRLYNSYTTQLLKHHNQIIKLHNDNNIPVSDRAKNFYDNRINELRIRLGNEYLKTIRQCGTLNGATARKVATLKKPYKLQSSSHFMRSKRRYTGPNTYNVFCLLKEMERAVEDEVILFKNNLDAYFKELLEKGVELIYAEKPTTEAPGNGDGYNY